MASAPASVATAIARSKPEPGLGQRGRREVHGDPPVAATRARTTSRRPAPGHATRPARRPGSPTSVNAGSEGARCASTSTTCPVRPDERDPQRPAEDHLDHPHEVVDLRGAPRGQQHRDHVDAHRPRRARRARRATAPRAGARRASLRAVTASAGMPERDRPARLDLDDDQLVAVERHDVELTVPAPPVPRRARPTAVPDVRLPPRPPRTAPLRPSRAPDHLRARTLPARTVRRARGVTRGDRHVLWTVGGSNQPRWPSRGRRQRAKPALPPAGRARPSPAPRRSRP